jgi:hypothetical protein
VLSVTTFYTLRREFSRHKDCQCSFPVAVGTPVYQWCRMPEKPSRSKKSADTHSTSLPGFGLGHRIAWHDRLFRLLTRQSANARECESLHNFYPDIDLSNSLGALAQCGQRAFRENQCVGCFRSRNISSPNPTLLLTILCFSNDGSLVSVVTWRFGVRFG